jgi:hypothetical protein
MESGQHLLALIIAPELEESAFLIPSCLSPESWTQTNGKS